MMFPLMVFVIAVGNGVVASPLFDLRKVLRMKLLSAHPDNGGSPEAFMAVQTEYQELLRITEIG